VSATGFLGALVEIVVPAPEPVPTVRHVGVAANVVVAKILPDGRSPAGPQLLLVIVLLRSGEGLV